MSNFTGPGRDGGRPDRIPVARPTISDTDRAAVDAVLRSGWIGSGRECAEFERELAEHLGAEHVVCTSSCTAALDLVMDYVGVGAGRRVAVPSWTYPATALPAVQRGAELVLVDCSPDSLTIDPESLERVLATGIDLVVPVHFAGTPVDPSVPELCEAHGAHVVEDAAHAFGASDERGPIRGVGSLAATFSFHATKNLTCGEGGAVATDDDALASFLRTARHHGMTVDAWSRETTGGWSAGDLVRPGYKANLPDLLAALGRSQLATFAVRQARRQELVTRYRDGLAGCEGLRFVPGDRPTGSSDHMVVVVLPDDVPRRLVVAALARHGVSSGLHYTPLHRLTWFRENATFEPDDVAVCERLAEHVLTLPLHAAMDDDDVDEVCSIVRDEIGRGRRS